MKEVKENVKEVKDKVDSTAENPVKFRKLTLSDLVTLDIVDQWYNCQINFVIPSLVLIDWPVVFLIPIFFFTLFGVYIGYKKRH